MTVTEVWTRMVKMGQSNELVQAIEDELERFKPPDGTPTYRSWRAYSAPGNGLAMMMKWDSLADSEKWWAAWSADPGSRPHLEKWNQLVLPGGTEELWYLRADVCGKC